MKTPNSTWQLHVDWPVSSTGTDLCKIGAMSFLKMWQIDSIHQ